MAKTVNERAAELAEALTTLQQAAEQWVQTPEDQSYERVRATKELSARAVAWTQAVQRTMKGGE